MAVEKFLEVYKEARIELTLEAQSDATWKCEYTFTARSTTGYGSAIGLTRRAAQTAALDKVKHAIDALL